MNTQRFSVLTALFFCTNCTLLAGQPWGQADLELRVEVDVEDDRLTDEGWIKTANDYAFEILDLHVGMTPLRLLSDAAPTSTESTGEIFDPANPPPSYSLCHNGHCHHDDGRLVDYEDIQAELDGGGGAAGPVTVVSRAIANSPVSLWPTAEPVVLENCDDACHIDRVSISKVDVGITELGFTARVVDLRPASTARLPSEGVTVTGTFDVATLFDIDLEERFDQDQPIGLRVSGAVVFQATMFDGVDVGSVVGTEYSSTETFDLSEVVSAQSAIAENIDDDTSLMVDVERFEPELTDNELALVPDPVAEAS